MQLHVCRMYNYLQLVMFTQLAIYTLLKDVTSAAIHDEVSIFSA